MDPFWLGPQPGGALMATYGIPTKALHEQWLGLVQPVGLVVAPAVLTKLELVPEQRTARLSALQLVLTTLLDEVDGWNGEPLQVVPGLRLLLTELLDWRDDDLLDEEALVAARGPEGVPEVVLSEYGETLRPTHGVPKLEGEGLQALVMDLTTLGEWGRDFDAPWNPSGHGWDATPQQRFERLLKETEHPIGLLFNGSQLRLAHAAAGADGGDGGPADARRLGTAAGGGQAVRRQPGATAAATSLCVV
jgi:hypothetical protein